jgi:hypothetical protein
MPRILVLYAALLLMTQAQCRVKKLVEAAFGGS